MIDYELPLAEIVFDFYDGSRSCRAATPPSTTSCPATAQSDLVKLDILVNGEPVDALSIIVHRDKAYRPRPRARRQAEGAHPAPDVRGRHPGRDRHARSSPATTVKALRKNVTAKCYGGDITRKRKLLEKQKEGKKRMKQVGTVEIPQEAFLAVLKVE